MEDYESKKPKLARQIIAGNRKTKRKRERRREQERKKREREREGQ